MARNVTCPTTRAARDVSGRRQQALELQDADTGETLALIPYAEAARILLVARKPGALPSGAAAGTGIGYLDAAAASVMSR